MSLGSACFLHEIVWCTFILLTMIPYHEITCFDTRYSNLVVSLLKPGYVQPQGSETHSIRPVSPSLRSNFSVEALQRQLEETTAGILSPEGPDQTTLPGCCWRVKVAFTKDHINGVYRLHPYIFGYYTMEPGLVNGRNHYASEPDGRFVISYCGDSWWIQSNDARGQCRGWAHSGWKIDQCVYDIEYSWRYYIPSVESFIDADKGLSVWCKS